MKNLLSYKFFESKKQKDDLWTNLDIDYNGFVEIINSRNIVTFSQKEIDRVNEFT